MKRRVFLGAAVGFGASLVACSSDEPQEPATFTAEGEMAMLTFTLTSEGGVERGMNDLTLEIESSEGVESGLVVAATLEMPSMSHGAEELDVEAQGSAYMIKQASFSMTGDWLLHVEATKDGEMLDHASFTISVA